MLLSSIAVLRSRAHDELGRNRHAPTIIYAGRRPSDRCELAAGPSHEAVAAASDEWCCTDFGFLPSYVLHGLAMSTYTRATTTVSTTAIQPHSFSRFGSCGSPLTRRVCLTHPGSCCSIAGATASAIAR